MEIALIGVAYWVTEDVDKPYVSDMTLSDVEMDRESLFASMAVAATMLFTSLMIGVHTWLPTCGQVVSGLAHVASGGIIIYLSIVFVNPWSMIWMVASAIAIAEELVLAQTLQTLVVALCYRL
jgi:hypothetical protein